MTANRCDLLLLHGWGMNSAMWGKLPQHLRGRPTPHPIDLPGHGGRPFDAGRRGLADWAEDCLGQAPAQAVWLGWSLGGLVALQAALLAPKRVRALILISTTPRFVQAADWRAAVAEETLARFSAGLQDDPSGTLERFLALQVSGDTEARTSLRTLRADLAGRPRPVPAALAAGLEILCEDDVRGRLPDVASPALWLFGERDSLVPAAVAERVEMLMPGARTRVITGAAHAPFLGHADALVAEIDAFLDGIAQ